MVAGLVRLRFAQVAKQSVIGTAVTAVRRVPWRGLVEYNPNRTDPDVDVGSIDPVIAPYILNPETSWNPTGPGTFNETPIRLSGGLKGGVSPVTAAGVSTWTYQVASLTQDSFDYWTVESGDDTEATNTIIGVGGVADSLEETMSEELGPWTISDQWVFATAQLGANGTNGLTVDDSPEFVFGGDTAIYMDSVAGSIGITPTPDSIHAATIRISNNLDRKRFANGSNTRNKLSDFARGARQIELVLTVAETAQWIAEIITLDDTPTPNRYFKVSTTSSEFITGSTPFKYDRLGAFRLFTVTDGEVGGNAVKILTYRAYYDSTLGYAYRAVVANSLTALP